MPARLNAFYSSYVEIAVENYYCAKNTLKEIEQKMDVDFCHSYFYKVEHSIIITCVFSIMALESYFNDFAAQNLGDDEFYDNFDKLSLISKFQLISKFILNVEIDKSKSYYSNLKSTEKIRNIYVHNKSKDFFDGKKPNNEVVFVFGSEDDSVAIESDIKILTKDLKDAKRAIEAIRDVANFFDETDKDCDAIIHLFSPYYSFINRDIDYIKALKKEFGLR